MQHGIQWNTVSYIVCLTEYILVCYMKCLGCT